MGENLGACTPGQQAREDVPAWSGQFWQDDEFGYISVHGADQRTHVPPDDSWRFVRAYESLDDDAFVFCYRKVANDWLCSDTALMAADG